MIDEREFLRQQMQYSRLFGAPPKTDVARFRQSL